MLQRRNFYFLVGIKCNKNHKDFTKIPQTPAKYHNIVYLNNIAT